MSNISPSPSVPPFTSSVLPALSLPWNIGDSDVIHYGDSVYRVSFEQDCDAESPRDTDGNLTEILAPGGREYNDTDEISSYADADGIHRFDASGLFGHYHGAVAYEIARLYLTGRDDVRAVFPLYGRGDSVSVSLPAVDPARVYADARRSPRVASYLPTSSLLFSGLYGGEPDGIVVVSTEAFRAGFGDVDMTDAALLAHVERELDVWTSWRRGEVYSVDVFRDVEGIDDDGRGPDGIVTESVEHIESCGGYYGDDDADSGARAFIVETILSDYRNRLPIRTFHGLDANSNYSPRPVTRAEFLTAAGSV